MTFDRLLCNCLESLPAQVGQLTVLRTLDLNECSSLESLPAEIGQLAGLEMLNLCGCSALRSLPTALILGTRPTQDPRAGKARLDLHGWLGGCQIHECVAEDPGACRLGS